MIHPTAHVDKGADIAKDAQVGPYCKISKYAILESGVTVEAHTVIGSHVTLCKNSHIHAFCQIGDSHTPILIGENCIIREFSHIGTDKGERNIRIDKNSYIMAYAHIGEGANIEKNCIITIGAMLKKNVHCQEGAIIAAKSTISSGCVIGTGSMIAAHSIVVSDIPPYCLTEGSPEASIRGLNAVGMRRNFKDKKSIAKVKRYFMQFKKGSLEKEHIVTLLEKEEDIYAKKFLRFIANHESSTE